MDLHATGRYQLECIDPGRPGATALDPTPPIPGRPFYYLMTAANCFGESDYGSDSAGAPRNNEGPPCP